MEYKPYSLNNIESIPGISALSPKQIDDMKILGKIFPFKTNNYVAEQLINWENVPDDPMFTLTFPRKGMLSPDWYEKIAGLENKGETEDEINRIITEIRLEMNPHPAGQIEHNVPILGEEKLYGMQHKYKETILFFPSQGQTCHAYCTFCFRWPQFIGMDELKFATNETDLLLRYITEHPEITDVLFTGGDPLVMKAGLLSGYIEPLLETGINTIRIGTRVLTYWPYRFLTDDDAGELLALFKKIRKSGKHLAFMAQFNHPVELRTDAVRQAITNILETGAIIRTQSPLIRNINDSPDIWAELWKQQVSLNCFPYYMFVCRNTGAQHFFSVPLVQAWDIFKKAYQSVSGISRTARGPVMSCLPGKIQVLGPADVRSEKVLVCRMIQGRDPDWADRIFFAEYDEKAIWYTDLKPAFNDEKFFFQDKLEEILLPDEFESDYE
ncbi:MAG: hypothetical protein JW712_07890 [Dehalococcoidales bacterium]|nr:hypothetical protein [Dehalococcoidales bacterium]